MKRIIHVSQPKIAKNRKKEPGEKLDPVLILRTYRGVEYANELTIKDDRGKPVARIIYSPHKPLDCGARVWIETYHDVEVTS